MWGTFGSLAVPWILFAQMSRDMSYVPVITATPGIVPDWAKSADLKLTL
jgi:hypothetical protein